MRTDNYRPKSSVKWPKTHLGNGNGNYNNNKSNEAKQSKVYPLQIMGKWNRGCVKLSFFFTATQQTIIIIIGFGLRINVTNKIMIKGSITFSNLQTIRFKLLEFELNPHFLSYLINW